MSGWSPRELVHERIPERVRGAAVRVGVVVVTVGLALAVARLLALAPMLGLLLAGVVLFVGVMAADVVAVPVLAMPFILSTARVGASGIDLTVSDAFLVVASAPAVLVAVSGISRPMRQALWLCAGYQVATLFTVLNNPYRANIVEWFHSGWLVGGALLVGWAVGRRGRARWGVGLLVAAGFALAVVTLVVAAAQYARGDFLPVEPRWPYPMQKNALGTVLAFVAVVVYAKPDWLGMRRWSSLGVFWVLVAAIFATQSRQSILGLAAAIVVLVLRRSTTRRRSKAILLAIIPALVVVSVMVQDQVKSGNQFNSFFQRVTWFQDAMAVWGTDPWFGVGLRWWYTDRFPRTFQPPNAEIETLTSSGVVGLAAFIVLMVGVWVIARRLDPRFGLVAELVIVARFVQSQLDLYWVSVQVTIPFLVLGVCLGAAAFHDAEEAERLQTIRELERAHRPAGAAR